MMNSQTKESEDDDKLSLPTQSGGSILRKLFVGHLVLGLVFVCSRKVSSTSGAAGGTRDHPSVRRGRHFHHPAVEFDSEQALMPRQSAPLTALPNVGTAARSPRLRGTPALPPLPPPQPVVSLVEPSVHVPPTLPLVEPAGHVPPTLPVVEPAGHMPPTLPDDVDFEDLPPLVRFAGNLARFTGYDIENLPSVPQIMLGFIMSILAVLWAVWIDNWNDGLWDMLLEDVGLGGLISGGTMLGPSTVDWLRKGGTRPTWEGAPESRDVLQRRL